MSDHDYDEGYRAGQQCSDDEWTDQVALVGDEIATLREENAALRERLEKVREAEMQMYQFVDLFDDGVEEPCCLMCGNPIHDAACPVAALSAALRDEEVEDEG